MNPNYRGRPENYNPNFAGAGGARDVAQGRPQGQ